MKQLIKLWSKIKNFFYFFNNLKNLFQKKEKNMALKDTWVNKVDGVDISSANDINDVAQAVIDLENETGSRPDFAANEGEEGFIKNRTHYIGKDGTVHTLPIEFIPEGVAKEEYVDNSVKALFVPRRLSEMVSDKYHRTVRDDERAKWNDGIIEEWEITKNYTAISNIVISEQTLTSMIWNKRQMDIQLEIPYAVYINGTVYFCIAGEEDGSIYIGNPTLFYSASTQPHNNEPFCITWAGGNATAGMFHKDDTLSYPLTLKVTRATVTTEKKIPEKYLPDGVGGGAKIDVVAEVGQTIVVEEVDADGKPTKWKAADYPAKEIEIIPQTTFKASYNSNFGCYMHGMSPIYSLVVGRTYTVVFDGVTYSCTAKSFYLQGMFGVYIGNSVLLGDNTGEPFTLVTVPAMGDGCSCLVFDANEHTMGLTANFIEHFDSLNAFPYYIEVTGSGTDDDPYTCAETFADIVALYDSGREIKAKNRTAINNSGGYETAIFDLYFAYDNAGVMFQFWFVCTPVIGSSRYLLFWGTEDGSLEITDNLD